MHARTRRLAIMSIILYANILFAAPQLSITGGIHGDTLAKAFDLALWTINYNTLSSGVVEAGGGPDGYGVWTRDAAYNASSAISLLAPSNASKTLWSCASASGIGGQEWDRIIWVMAAWNHYLITADAQFLSQAYSASAATLATSESAYFNKNFGLFTGRSFFNDGCGFPPQMCAIGAVDGLMCLSTNCLYYKAYLDVAAMTRELNKPETTAVRFETKAAALKLAIQKNLWRQDLGRFCYFLTSGGTQDPRFEGTGIAFSILFGVADSSQAHSMSALFQSSNFGAMDVWPGYDDAGTPVRHTVAVWPHVPALVAHAAASVGAQDLFAGELFAMAHMALDRDKGNGHFCEVHNPYSGVPGGGYFTWFVSDQTWCATGYVRAIINGLFGMRFEKNGIRFAPALPHGMGTVRLSGLSSYRAMDLTITMSGEGATIEEFLLDGVRQAMPFVPAIRTGSHQIAITLRSGIAPGIVNAFIIDNSHVALLFDRAMDGASCRNAANYRIDGQTVADSAVLLDDGRTVIIAVRAGLPLEPAITVQGVRDASSAGAVVTKTDIIPARLSPGLGFEIYSLPADFNRPVFSFMNTAPQRTGVSSTADLSKVSEMSGFGLCLQGLLFVGQSGIYGFRMTADTKAASWLCIDNRLAISPNPAASEANQWLAQGYHYAELIYSPGSGKSLSLSWRPPSGVWQAMPSSALFHIEGSSVTALEAAPPREPKAGNSRRGLSRIAISIGKEGRAAYRGEAVRIFDLVGKPVPASGVLRSFAPAGAYVAKPGHEMEK